MVDSIKVDRYVDAKGQLCPMPIISVRRAIQDLERGQVLAVDATDAGSRRDIPAWAEATGHRLLHAIEDGNVLTFYIEKAGWDEDD